MLNLALVALLSGSLFAAPDGDCKKERTCERDQAAVALEATYDTRSIISDTYAFGRAAHSAPIKLWVEYGRGSVEEFYTEGGTVVTNPGGAKVVGQRVAVGVQLNVVNFSTLKFGVGGELGVAQDKASIGGTTVSESSFGLQGAKIFGMLRGRVMGIHGGYLLDLADAPTVDNTRASSDQRDAIFFGADFDYPSEHFRLFGAVDYIMPQSGDVVSVSAEAGAGETPGGTNTFTDDAKNNILLFTGGAGVRFSVFELGAAIILRAQDERGRINASGTPNGGHAGTIAPYLRISPPSLPMSLYVKGAVIEEYADYGYNLGGGNDLVSGFGFTAGLSIGFE